jgi:hypothetical protein
MYATAIVLCVAGMLCMVVGDAWSGKTPLSQGKGLVANASTTNAPGQGKTSSANAPAGIITADTDIFWVSRYLKCGHEKVREEAPDETMIGKTYAQFAQNYPNYKLDVENGVVRMVVEYDQYCPDHYIIKADDNGSIFVYRNMEGMDKLSAVMKMNFTTDDVPKDYRPLLKDGMVFDSVEEIEGLIEDAET